MLILWMMVLEEVALGTRRRQQEMLEVEEMAVVEGTTVAVGALEAEEHIVVVSEEVEENGHTVEEGIARIGEDGERCGIEEEGATGSSSRHRVACRCCTSAADTADAGAGYTVLSFSLYLAACLALPADDGHSSCRRG